MKILFVLLQPGNKEPVKNALVPLDKLSDVKLDEINGKVVNMEGEFGACDEHEANEIMKLFKRFGLEESDEEANLAQYVDNVPTPMRAQGIVTIGWAP